MRLCGLPPWNVSQDVIYVHLSQTPLSFRGSVEDCCLSEKVSARDSLPCPDALTQRFATRYVRCWNCISRAQPGSGERTPQFAFLLGHWALSTSVHISEGSTSLHASLMRELGTFLQDWSWLLRASSLTRQDLACAGRRIQCKRPSTGVQIIQIRPVIQVEHVGSHRAISEPPGVLVGGGLWLL